MCVLPAGCAHGPGHIFGFVGLSYINRTAGHQTKTRAGSSESQKSAVPLRVIPVQARLIHVYQNNRAAGLGSSGKQSIPFSDELVVGKGTHLSQALGFHDMA